MIIIHTLSAFLLTIIAGSATMLGIFPVLFRFHDQEKLIAISLGFASGVMLSASFFDLVPEAYLYFASEYQMIPSILFVSVFFILGILLSTWIHRKMDFQEDKLYQVGISSMIAIIIHNLPEGIITFLTASIDIRLGISLAIAILLHNIPEGISIAVPIYYSTKSKLKAFFYTFIAAFSEPLGALLAFIFLKNYITNFFLGILLSIIAGIMVNISLYELLPQSLSYNRKITSILSVIIGLIFMWISIILL